MRIEICGGGAVGLLQQNLRGMRGGITATIESLQSVRRQLTGISGGATGNVSNAISGVNDRIQEENAKLERVQTLEKKTDDFLLHTVAADQQVARTVTQNREQLFSKYSWLRPAGSGIQSWWDERVKDWKRFWSKAGEAIGKVVDGVVTFIKEHAVQLIVGTLVIVACAALTFFSGGTFLAALGAGVKAALISAAISGAISATVALFSGENVLSAFGDGFADGYMWGGIFAGASQAIASVFRFTKKLGAAGKTFNTALGKLKIWSPNSLANPTPGGTLFKIGQVYRLDFEAYEHLIHTHIPYSLYNKLPKLLQKAKWIFAPAKNDVHVHLIPFLGPLASLFDH